jgi:hypothetical protein
MLAVNIAEVKSSSYLNHTAKTFTLLKYEALLCVKCM